MSNLALLASAALSLWWVDPYGDKPYMPDEPPDGGVETNVLSCAAAQGEIESLSFCVKPVRDMRKVGFTPSDLTGPGGAVIPASCADFALVKVWYRADTRWWNSWQGNIWAPTLIPNLIIHDDDLVHVVESEEATNRTVLVRISYPEGVEYVDMRKHGGKGSAFNHSLHPVIDAPSFVPFDLKKDRFQQYWLTWKVPSDAKPGLYKGSLAVSEDGAHLADIPLELEVYPFTLPSARTHYDTSQPYVSMWMGVPNLWKLLKDAKRLDVAERKARAIYRSCAEHNANCQGPGGFTEDSTDDFSVRSLVMMLQEGMTCDMFVNDSAFQSPFLVAMLFDYEAPEDNPQKFIAATNMFARRVAVTASVMDRYLGHRNCYFHSLDECGTHFNRLSYPFWGMLHAAGFKVWTDSGDARDVSWSVDMNDLPADGRHERQWEWHKAGAKTVTYAGPFTGPIDPDIWRRSKGVRYYYADMDGLHEYCFDTAENAWNDFSPRSEYSQFQFVYLTYDGLITTLPWEAVREALDDVRYLSLLRLRAEAAMRSPDESVRALGRRHFVWMDSLDPELIVDLFAFRRELARRIIELMAVVGPEPPEPRRAAPPKLPPLSDDVAATPTLPRDRAARAKELAEKNRYDLAIPMWESLRSDTSLTPEDRFAAAMAEAVLQSELLRRDDALATIDATLKMPDLYGYQRAKLKLLRAKLLVTSRIFEEEFTKKQLDEAAEAVTEALKLPGADEEERYDAITGLAEAYVAGGDLKAAIAFVEECLKSLKASKRPKHDQSLYLILANAHFKLSNWDKAAAMFRKARFYGRLSDRGDVRREGEVAEKRDDWATVVKCYTEEIKMYDTVDDKKKIEACRKRIASAMEKLQAQQSKKEMTPIDDVGETMLDLDE